MDWSSIAGKMAEIGLPAIGGIFGGPLGRTVGGVLGGAIAQALGVPATPEAVKEAVDTRPNDQIRLALAQVEAEASRVEQQFADIANARLQTVQLAQSGSSIAWGAPVVSVVVTLGFFFVLGMLFFLPADMPPNTFALLNILLGVLAGQFTQVGGYWLGSSDGSKRSGEALRAVAAQAQATLTAQAAPPVVLPRARR